jgi:hypothetical protein
MISCICVEKFIVSLIFIEEMLFGIEEIFFLLLPLPSQPKTIRKQMNKRIFITVCSLLKLSLRKANAITA